MPGDAARQPRMLAAPDKLKGTMTAAEVAGVVADAGEAAGWEVDRCPLSDGGEGFAEVLSCLGGEERRTTVTGPLGQPVEARWRLWRDWAVVESAAASGLVLAGGADGNDPLGASSRGTGELVVAALDAGARRIIVGVGGSAMTDGGSGAVAAIEEAGGLRGADVLVACDVQAVFVEAAARFGPQKGASPSEVGELTRRLEQLASSYLELYGVDVSVLPGAGAAGGLAGGLAAIGARLTPGFALVAGIVGLAERIEESELVVTAEGRLDASSWTGKVVGEVADCAARNRVPLVVVAGAVDPEAAREAHRQGIELVDLSARFGRERALADPAACIGEGLREVLAAGPPG